MNTNSSINPCLPCSLICLRSLVSFCLLVSLLSLGACSKSRENLSPMPSIDAGVKANLSAPVDCRSARQDIALLTEEKASVGKQLLAGVRSIFPIAAVGGILMGDYNDRVEVATGQYNSDLEAKILQIKSVCNR